MLGSKAIGESGENLAAQYLTKMGYKILERNYVGQNRQGPKSGEIDIVARKGGVIHFVEVKTVLATKDILEKMHFRPEERVSFQKQMKIVKTAQRWLISNRIPLESKWQIDVLGVAIDSKTKRVNIRHFQNIIPAF